MINLKKVPVVDGFNLEVNHLVLW